MTATRTDDPPPTANERPARQYLVTVFDPDAGEHHSATVEAGDAAEAYTVAGLPGRLVSAVRIPRNDDHDHPDLDPRLVSLLRQAADEWGALGVLRAAGALHPQARDAYHALLDNRAPDAPEPRDGDNHAGCVCQSSSANLFPRPPVTADEWNNTHPIGKRVLVATTDDLETCAVLATRTRTVAWDDAGTPVVAVKGTPGCFPLTRVSPVTP